MRPTKSKEQLAYYKHLLAIDKKRNELANRKDDEDNYIEIPRMLIGYKIKLIPVDSLKIEMMVLQKLLPHLLHGFVFLISHSGYAV
ncbi:MAG: hypothetical protein L6V86_01235 [Treponema sp.]|nr:MAG: hypothetical protein L6V86_01235 [Treponema sp.]